MIVDRRRGEGRNDEREKTERSILRPIQRVLADAAAHLARIVWSRAALGQPAIGREQPRKRRPQRLDARPIVVNRRPQPLGLRDQRADLRGVHEESEVIVAMSEVAHGMGFYSGIRVTSSRAAIRPAPRPLVQSA